MQNKMWLVGMMLIAFFVGMMSSQNTTAQESNEIGRYQISGASRDNEFRAYMIDTATGRVWRCETVDCWGMGYVNSELAMTPDAVRR